jgi:hypothetical protein
MCTTMQVAGPGGVLAVLPAIQLNDYRQALVYLAFFCVTSALTMGESNLAIIKVKL